MADCGVLVTKETSNSDLLDNSEHVNAFWKAVGVGDVAEVQKVLDGGWVEEIDCVVGGELKGDVGVDLEGHWGRSALMVASGRGHCDLVRFLQEKGAQVDFQDYCGKSALMLASECGQHEVARLLLDRGAEVGLRDCVNGKSALMIASECGQCEVVKLLLDAGAQVDLQDKVGRTAIVLASKHEHWKVGVLLLERMAGVDSATLSAIMSAVMVKCKPLLEEHLYIYLDDFFEYIEELIKRASLTECYQEILWLACWCGNFKLCQAFVAKCRWVELTPLWGVALFLACACGHCEIVALLLEKGFPQDLVHYGEYSALAMVGACIRRRCEVVKLLLGRGADVNAAVDSKHFREILDWLCIPPDSIPELALVSKGAQVDLQDIHGKSALSFAFDMKQYEMAEILLESGAHVKLEDQSTWLEMLWFACEGGNLLILRLILGRYPWVNKFGKSGRSPLMFASKQGFCEMASLLLDMDMGAQVDLQNSNGMSALMFSNNQEVAKLMLESGAQVDLQDNAGRSALMFSSKQGFFEVAKLLVDNGAQVDLQDSAGRSALVFASKQGFFEVAKLLVYKGAQVDLQDNAGRSALAWACHYSSQEVDDLDELHSQYRSSAMIRYNGNYKIAELLLESGAKLALPEGSLVWLYLSACKREDCGVVELLLDSGVEVDAKVKCGMGSTGLMHASKGGHCELVELLLGRGSKVNQQYMDGKSSLMYASEGGHAEVVKLLLKAGARPDMQAQFGVSAKKLAEERNHMDIVKLLEDPSKVSNIC